jgi:hypothetical protein
MHCYTRRARGWERGGASSCALTYNILSTLLKALFLAHSNGVLRTIPIQHYYLSHNALAALLEYSITNWCQAAPSQALA